MLTAVRSWMFLQVYNSASYLLFLFLLIVSLFVLCEFIANYVLDKKWYTWNSAHGAYVRPDDNTSAHVKLQMLESIVDTELIAENKCYDDQEDVYSSNTTGYTNIYKRRPIHTRSMM